ncbi:hypothetical protein EDF59_1043 [Novosphingobium sp. ST904]|nr:hypothetical protein EDF59_1043 [Novosphingobium sp. ST904]
MEVGNIRNHNPTYRLPPDVRNGACPEWQEISFVGDALYRRRWAAICRSEPVRRLFRNRPPRCHPELLSGSMSRPMLVVGHGNLPSVWAIWRRSFRWDGSRNKFRMRNCADGTLPSQQPSSSSLRRRGFRYSDGRGAAKGRGPQPGRRSLSVGQASTQQALRSRPLPAIPPSSLHRYRSPPALRRYVRPAWAGPCGWLPGWLTSGRAGWR